MWLLILSMRRPLVMLVGVISIVLLAVLSLSKMPIDIFPNLGVPMIYISQPYGGMSPEQMEGYISSAYEYHFLYITGIKSVESKNIQGAALYKLTFQPGTDMAEAISETVAQVNRSRELMPPGTVPPFILRFDAGSLPVGYLVFSSQTKSIGEIQDQALYKVRPLFASLPGVSSPPPFGGSARTIVLNIDPEKLRNYNLSPEQVLKALTANNQIIPSGNIAVGNYYPLTPINGDIENIEEFNNIPITTGAGPMIFLHDVGWAEDASDIITGYALVNGKRSVYIPVAKRADASTWSVVQAVKKSMKVFQNALPPDIKVSYEFDQSRYVKEALSNLAEEGGLGAILTGLMVLLFLHSWRSTLVVIANIPISILFAIILLALSHQSINIMTLGGLALSIGILVDESTIVIENIHTYIARGKSPARAVKDSFEEIALPMLLVVLCVLAVFAPTFLMSGVPKSLFTPLALSVGFAMIGSYLLSQTLVPVLAVWFLKGHENAASQVKSTKRFSFEHVKTKYGRLLHYMLRHRVAVIILYLCLSVALFVVCAPILGSELFPNTEGNQFRFRLRAPNGTRIEQTELYTKESLKIIQEEAGGSQNVSISMAYVGQQPSSYAVNAIYLWTSGPQESVMTVQLHAGIHISIPALKEKLRNRFKKELPEITVSFEPADLISQILSLNTQTPIEVDIRGKNLESNHNFAQKIRKKLATLPYIRDLEYGQSLDYPTLNIKINREMASQLGVTVNQLKNSIVPATSSSRFLLPVFWLDRKSGLDYQIQVQVPQPFTTSINNLLNLPAMPMGKSRPLLGDLSKIDNGQIVGEYDHLNNQRMLSLTANLHAQDLGHAVKDVQQTIKSLGEPPRGIITTIRGQAQLMIETLTELRNGLILSIITIFLLLTANFQSFKLAFTSISTIPAALCGIIIMLLLTGTTINIQSAMGAIMAIGIIVSNAILLITVAEEYRKEGKYSIEDATIMGAQARLRPILMTSFAMNAGMIPMSLGVGEGGEQIVPLGRAVIGGLILATIANLLILPLIFSMVQQKSSLKSGSLDPDDPESPSYINSEKDSIT